MSKGLQLRIKYMEVGMAVGFQKQDLLKTVQAVMNWDSISCYTTKNV